MKLSRRFLLVALAALLLSTAADVTLLALHMDSTDIFGGNWVDYWPTFAVLVSIAIVLAAKLVGQRWLQRPINYYRDADDD